MLELKENGSKLEGILQLSDCEKEFIVKWLSGSSQASFFIGDSLEEQQRIKDFIDGEKLCFLDLKSYLEYLKTVKQIIKRYKSLYHGPFDRLETICSRFSAMEQQEPKLVLGYTYPDRYIHILNTKKGYAQNVIKYGETVLKNGDDFRHSFVGGITKIVIQKTPEGQYRISIKLIENWREAIMKVSGKKVTVEAIIRVFKDEMRANTNEGISETDSALLFGIKFAPLLHANSSKFSVSDVVLGAGYNQEEIIKAVNSGISVSPKVIWENDAPQGAICLDVEKEGSAEEYGILNRNIYGIHIKNKNNALSSEDSHICIGWSRMGDLTNIDKKEDIVALHIQCFPNKTTNSRAQDVCQIWTFVKLMAIGDLVVFGDGKTAHIGAIDSDYYYDETNGDQDADYVNNRKVKWLKDIEYSNLPKALKNSLGSARSVFSLNPFKSAILELLEKGFVFDVDETEGTEEDSSEYTKEIFLGDVFMTSAEYDSLYHLLKHKKNLILQGPPGVGKTYLAKKFAYSIIGRTNKEQVEMIQFHQSYSYEDFIMGYKPDGEGFKLNEGVFYNFCKKAEENPEKEYFFIIDEINRGNLSKIFGELMMLIEGDKRNQSVKLAYRDEEFAVPENVYLLGMMNTADRSLALMDYALRRRFAFFEIEPAFGKPAFEARLKEYISDDSIVKLIVGKMTELNLKIADENNSGLGKGFCIGHSYFCVKPVDGQSDQEWYNAIIQYEISPLLDEYWWDDKAKAEDCKKELLRD